MDLINPENSYHLGIGRKIKKTPLTGGLFVHTSNLFEQHNTIVAISKLFVVIVIIHCDMISGIIIRINFLIF